MLDEPTDVGFDISFRHLSYTPAHRTQWIGSKRDLLAIPSRGVPRSSTSLSAPYMQFAEPQAKAKPALHHHIIRIPDFRPPPDPRFLPPEDWQCTPRSQSAPPAQPPELRSTRVRTSNVAELRKRLHPRGPIASLLPREQRDYPRNHNWYKARSKSTQPFQPGSPAREMEASFESADNAMGFPRLSSPALDRDSSPLNRSDFFVGLSHEDSQSSMSKKHSTPQRGWKKELHLADESSSRTADSRSRMTLTPILSRRQLQSNPRREPASPGTGAGRRSSQMSFSLEDDDGLDLAPPAASDSDDNSTPKQKPWTPIKLPLRRTSSFHGSAEQRPISRGGEASSGSKTAEPGSRPKILREVTVSPWTVVQSQTSLEIPSGALAPSMPGSRSEKGGSLKGQ